MLVINASNRKVDIKIVVTSDIHATVFPYDFINNMPLGYGLANVQYLMESVKGEYQNKIILLDNGDLVQGQPTAYWANNIDKNKVNLFARIMNFMNYDAATVGNHDIEAGPEVYNAIKKQMQTPWLGANIIDKKTGEPYFIPYIVLNRSGVRIAVLGMVTPAVTYWIPEKLYEGLVIQDMVEAAEYWVSHIKEKEAPDAIIGLFHSGLGIFDPQDPTKKLVDNVSAYIAHYVPGFDVIFTGHDHLEHNKFVINKNGDSVLVIGPGPHGKNVAVAHLDFDREAKRKFNLSAKRGEIYKISGLPPSVNYLNRFEKDINEVFEYSIQKVGFTNADINIKESLFGNSAAVDFIHKVQLHFTQADISFAAPLNPDLIIKSGDIRIRDMFKWYPFENYLYTMELTGSEILGFLEYNYGLWFNYMVEENDLLLNYRLDSLGNPDAKYNGTSILQKRIYNFDSAAGIKYTVDVSKPQGERISIHQMENGEEFFPEKRYKVALNSYRGSGGGFHMVKGAGISQNELRSRVVDVNDNILRLLMIEYIKSLNKINPEPRNNWGIIPIEWVEKAREKELKILWP